MSMPDIRTALDTFQQAANRGTTVYLSPELVQELRAALKAEPEGERLNAADLLPVEPPNIPTTMATQYRSAWREGVEDGWSEARAVLARWGHPSAAAPAPGENLATPSALETPAETLAARPLLERVAQLGDVIGRQTVAQVQQLANQAAVWLRENPPGRPVTIEPRGCPTPGACSCVEPTPPSPEVGEEMEVGESVTHDLKVWSSYFESLLDGTKNFEVRFNDRGFKSGHYLRLREWLNNEYTGRELTKRVTYVLQGGLFGLEAGYVALALAAKQSELAALRGAPVVVSERPWELEGWTDKRGHCWRFDPCESGWWSYGRPVDPMDDPSPWTHMAPHNAIPLPAPQDGEVEA
jgi:hypothetical protein